MTPEIKEGLIKIRDFIQENPWCQGYYAKDSEGVEVMYYSPHAHSYCLIGAIGKVYGPEDRYLKHKIMEILETTCSATLADFNDTLAKSKEDVIKLINDTIGVT